MILDTIKKFHAQFGDLSEDDCGLLEVIPLIESAESIKAQFCSGNWSALHFSTLDDFRISYALRIMPNMSGTQWPVYALCPEGEFQSSSLTTYLPFIYCRGLFSDPVTGKEFKENWERKYELMLAVQKVFGGTDSDFDEVKDILFDESKWAKAGKEYAKENMPDDETVWARHREFWLSRDTSEGCRYLFDLLGRVTTDEKYLPEPAPEGLGIYEDRIKMIIAMRTLKLHGGSKVMLQGLLMPHGYNIESRFPAIIPSCGFAEYLIDLAEIAALGFNINDRSEWEKIPEMVAFKRIAGQAQGNIAMAFLEAAAIRDEKFNQPLQAWNNLVSAGFWTGRNMGNTAQCAQAQAVLIEAALALCQKHNWLEAREVLKYNLDIMQSA